MGWFFYLETIECSLVQDLMASIGKRVGNLNSGRRYLITVVLFPYNRHLFFHFTSCKYAFYVYIVTLVT